jgi:Xaa-Pro aminopeptidase
MTLTGTDRTVFDSRAEYAGRLARVRSTMAEAGVDALLVADTDDFTRPEGGNVRFLANVALPTSVGAPIALVAVVPREGEPTLIVPPTGFNSAPLLVSRRSWIERIAGPPPMPFLEAVKAMGGGARPGSGTAELVVAALEETGLSRSRIGLCGTFAGLDQVRELLPAATFVPATVLDDAGKPHDVVEYERTRTKTAYEIECMRHAQACVEAGMRVFEQVVVEGVPYTEAVAEGSRAMVREGAEETFCPASRGRGPSGTYSLPGWSYGTYARGDMIAFELNARVAGYWAQLPRSWVVGGEPDRDQSKAYDCAWRAFEVMRDRLAVGVTGAELWDAALAVVSGEGMEPFGRYGHGMGISQAEWFSVLVGDERRVQEGQSVVLHGAVFDPATGNEALVGEQFVMQDGEARPISTASLVKPALSRVVENA